MRRVYFLVAAWAILSAGCLLEWDRTWGSDAARDSNAPDMVAPDGPVVDRQIKDLPQPDAAVPQGWAIPLGSQKAGQVRDVALDKSNNIYITGFFAGELRAGSTTLTAKTDKTDIFVAKLSADGKVQWVISGGGPGDGRGNAVTVDHKRGGVFVVGHFFDYMYLDQTYVKGGGEVDAFAARIRADGTVDWVKHFGDLAYQSCAGLAFDSTSDVLWITGKFTGEIIFGSDTFKNPFGPFDMYLARLSAVDGAPKKALQVDGSGPVLPLALSLDSGGNAYVAGHFGGAKVGDKATLGSEILTGKGGYDIFVARILASSNTFDWAVSAGSPQHDELRDMVVDSKSNTFITGFHGGPLDLGGISVKHSKMTDLLVAKVSPTGTFLWARSTISDGDEVGEAIALSPANDVVVAGYFIGAASFDGKNLPFKGVRDVMLLRLSATKGDLLGQTTSGSPNWEQARGLAVSGKQAHVVGFFDKTGLFGQSSIKTQGGEDGFIWKAPLP